MTGQPYQREVLVRFAHCDPAGIVFYPRYFEMINGVVEDWFEDALESSFSGLLHHRNLATPTVHFTVDFVNASMMGDRLTFALSVTRFGTSSFDVTILASCQGEERLRVKQVLLFTDAKARGSQPIPADLRKRMERYFIPEQPEADDADA
ncbi:MAG: acyl-CoA thioesterase [Sphingobacteriales bacterium]|nr:MAG: acyl-CoA thioesterase [Sphingobacteriales bacterium]